MNALVPHEQALRTLCLPDSLQRLVSGLKVGFTEVIRQDGVRACMTIPTIVASLAPSMRDRVTIARRLDDLALIQAQRDTDIGMAKVAEMLMAFQTGGISPEGAKARANGYMAALQDLPTFAIVEACLRWLRGEAGEQNYNFAPTPPVLRQVAEKCARLADYQVAQLQMLLEAEVVPDPIEYSDEHCEAMRKRLRDHLHVLFKKNCREDGVAQEAAE
jgi:hypothetical protein